MIVSQKTKTGTFMDEINNRIKMIARFFRSRKLTIYLLILVILVSVLGSIIPQEHIYSPATLEEMLEQSEFLVLMQKIGFTAIFTSWLFFSIMFLLYLNTIFCTYDMFKNTIRKIKKGSDFKKKDEIDGFANHTVVVFGTTSDSTRDKVVSNLKMRRYSVEQDGNRIAAIKNRLGVLGTPAFHLCILLVLGAILYGGVGRMEGRLQLVEGQTLYEQHQDYMYVAEGPLFDEKHRNYGVLLERFHPQYEDKKNVYRGAASELVITDGDKVVKRDVVHSNHLVIYEDVSLFQNEYGFAPLFLLKNETGAVISGSYVYAEDDGSGRYMTVFPVADTGLVAQITLYPNSSRRILESGYDIPPNPQVYLELFEGGQPVFDGVLGLDQMVVLGSYPDAGEVTLGFYDLKQWSIIAVVIDRGVPYIFGGIYLAVLSMMVMFFFSPRHLWAVVEEGEDGRPVLYIGGKSDRYKSSFEVEFNNLIEGIEEAVQDGAA
ncbi:MAG: cytochrome c biogenesis protein ResB [ANME-2 cluster archaeon]|nr:cytochrome c biogenesis protein ResB [ANME-2 cluster archaeon]